MRVRDKTHIDTLILRVSVYLTVLIWAEFDWFYSNCNVSLALSLYIWSLYSHTSNNVHPATFEKKTLHSRSIIKMLTRQDEKNNNNDDDDDNDHRVNTIELGVREKKEREREIITSSEIYTIKIHKPQHRANNRII